LFFTASKTTILKTPVDKKTMSVWIEKYRPTSIKHVSGHKSIIEVFKYYVKTKQFPNIILHGESGCGKTSTILALSRDIYKEDFEHDVYELNASDERGIDVVRNKIHSLSKQKPKSNIGYKMIILDEADFLTSDAQAALRKIMEDYSDKTIFCLMCNYIHNIIPEIVSRCAGFYFKPLLDRDIFKKLNEISTKENLNVSNDTINKIINASNGDLRRAILLLQQTTNDTFVNPDILTDDEMTTIFSPSSTYAQIYACVDKICDDARVILKIVRVLFHHVMTSDTIQDDVKFKLIACIKNADKHILLQCNERLQLLHLCVKIHESMVL
jgi:DNA polymerase III delta prime subunit